MPRIARISIVNYPHHVTQRGNNRETVFFDDDDREFYLKTLKTYSMKCSLEISAYCLMANHVHLLCVPRKEMSLSKGVGVTNLIYTQYVNRKYKRSGRLWQNRFFSTVIEEDIYLWAVARYIESNPVRANIVKDAKNYRWSSAKAHLLGDKDDVLSDNEWLVGDRLTDYRNLFSVSEQETDKVIRKATATGRPLGTESFLKRLEDMLEMVIMPKKVGRPRKKSLD